MEQKDKQFLGWIALDIDGTITLDKYSVPDPVIHFLQNCIQKGWRLAIATGRPLTFALKGLEKFNFPYLILAQNGTIAFEMPSQKILLKRYLPLGCLDELERAFVGAMGGFVVFSGYENQDQMYWQPHRFNHKQKMYVESFAKTQGTQTIAIESLNEIPFQNVPLIKCFGSSIEMNHIAQELSKNHRFNCTVIRDPYLDSYFLMLVTDRSSSKGQTLEEVVRLYGDRGTVIAAGDDENDISLLNAADIKIAMSHAPKSLLKIAHIVAPPTSEHGIIHALQTVLRLKN